MKRLAIILVVLAVSSAGAHAGFEDDFEVKKWTEIAVQLPPPPKTEDLASFYVSAVSSHSYSVDLSSISVGGDGVVRYTLVIESSGGVRNVSFEGIRCLTRERRIYAFGRDDGSWSKARNSEWARIRDAAELRHHAALFMDHFCPVGVLVGDAAAARNTFLRARQNVSPATGIYIGR